MMLLQAQLRAVLYADAVNSLPSTPTKSSLLDELQPALERNAPTSPLDGRSCNPFVVAHNLLSPPAMAQGDQGRNTAVTPAMRVVRLFLLVCRFGCYYFVRLLMCIV
eukprot:m.287110 g.287110  ORF g.287110 m.287110 type:complete len:107 (-) comp15787_c2_seq3:64-384(-)